MIPLLIPPIILEYEKMGGWKGSLVALKLLHGFILHLIKNVKSSVVFYDNLLNLPPKNDDSSKRGLIMYP